ncbi:MAG TPA: hypothetical protein VHC22_11105 [Pirellulales bacterium]|nr:hypothetical protein [Pirellulales bacterium]
MSKSPCGGAGRLLFLWLSVLVLCTGCGKVELGQVSGKVLLNGQPVGGVQVQFIPDAKNKEKLPTSLGATDAQGQYSLMSSDGRSGAALGEHMIVLHDVQLPSGSRLVGRAEADAPATSSPATAVPGGPRLPKVYRQPATTPLRKTVHSGEQAIDLELTGTP